MSEQTEPAWLRLVALPGAFAAGVLVTLQSKVNATLGGRIGSGPRSGIAAAVVSFGGGLLVLTVLLALLPAWRRDLGRLRASVADGDLPVWQTLGGLLGAGVVASQGLSVETIGVALFIVALVAGQTSSALLVDHLGLGPAGRTAVTPGRVLGAGLAVAAVVVSGSGSLSGGALVVVLALLPLLAGGGNAVQQAISAQVGRRSSAWVATWVNFLVGTAGLLVALLLTLLLPGHLDAVPSDWWLYTGGLMGIGFISAAAVLVPAIGVLMFMLASVVGQVLAALAVDLVSDPSSVTARTYVAAVLTFAGVSVAALSQRRARQREQDQRDSEPAAA